MGGMWSLSVNAMCGDEDMNSRVLCSVYLTDLRIKVIGIQSYRAQYLLVNWTMYTMKSSHCTRIPIEGVLTQAREAVGQLDRRHRGAASEGTTTDDHEASGQLNERQLQVQSEGWRLVALGQT